MPIRVRGKTWGGNLIMEGQNKTGTRQHSTFRNTELSKH